MMGKRLKSVEICSGLIISLCFLALAVQKSSAQSGNCSYVVSNDQELQNANANVLAGQSVCLKTGTYNQPIRPSRSGTAESQRIRYVAFGDGGVNVRAGFDLSDRSYITVSDINIESPSWGYANLNNGYHCVIENGRFTKVATHPGFNLINASYNVIRNNFIGGREDDGYIDVIQLLNNAHHNLIEDNYFEQLGEVGEPGPHTNILLEGDGTDGSGEDPHHNIIRDNTFYNEVHHCINVQGGSHHNIFDNNIFSQCGTDGEAWHAWQSEGIYRFNIVLRSGGRDQSNNAFGGFSFLNTDNVVQAVNNRVYHNVFFHNGGFAFRLGYYGNHSDNSRLAYRDNKFVNNIVYENNQYVGRSNYSGPQEVQIYYERSWAVSENGLPQISGEEWRSNLIGDSGKQIIRWLTGYLTLGQAETLTNPDFVSNVQGDPGFVNAANNDYHLASGSRCINTGDFLTFTTSTSSGTTVSVVDARFFADGFGIVEGDAIQIGNDGADGTLRVTSVDYGSNRLTLNRSISWNANEGVSMPYSGSKPDIGVFESSSATPPQTCSQLGGTCLNNPCSSYQNCNSLTGSCTSGYCCSGSCSSALPGDLNSDNVVDIIDLVIVGSNFGKDYNNVNTDKRADANGDKVIDIVDLVIVGSNFGR